MFICTLASDDSYLGARLARHTAFTFGAANNLFIAKVIVMYEFFTIVGLSVVWLYDGVFVNVRLCSWKSGI